jgi:hypothetical protein
MVLPSRLPYGMVQPDQMRHSNIEMLGRESTSSVQSTKSLRDNPLRGGPAAGAVTN